MRSLSLLACSVLAVHVLAQTTTPSKKEAKVRAYLANGKAYKAINQCNGALGRDPQPVFFVLRADARNRIGEHALAEGDARKGLAALPGSWEALLQLAIAEQGLGLNDSAIVHFGRALDPGPSLDVLYRLAQVHQAKGDCANALARTGEILATPKVESLWQARALRTRGECFAHSGDTAAARLAFDEALRIAPDDPITYNSRGWFLHAQRGEHALAIVDYDHAIKLNPNYSYAFNNRGWSRYKSGDKDGGLKDISLSQKKKAYNPYIYRNLGVIALESGDTASACMRLRQALDYNYTTLYGDEVERLVKDNCRNERRDAAPVQPPNAPADRPRTTPATRTNAP